MYFKTNALCPSGLHGEALRKFRTPISMRERAGTAIRRSGTRLCLCLAFSILNAMQSRDKIVPILL